MELTCLVSDLLQVNLSLLFFFFGIKMTVLCLSHHCILQGDKLCSSFMGLQVENNVSLGCTISRASLIPDLDDKTWAFLSWYIDVHFRLRINFEMVMLGWMLILRSKRLLSTGLNSIEIHVHLGPLNVTFFRNRVLAEVQGEVILDWWTLNTMALTLHKGHMKTQSMEYHMMMERCSYKPRKVKGCQYTAMGWKKGLEHSPYLPSEELIHSHLDFRLWPPERVNICCSKPPCRWWFVITVLENKSASFLWPRALTTEPGRWSQVEIWSSSIALLPSQAGIAASAFMIFWTSVPRGPSSARSPSHRHRPQTTACRDTSKCTLYTPVMTSPTALLVNSLLPPSTFSLCLL